MARLLQVAASPTAPCAYLDDYGKAKTYRWPSMSWHDQYASHDGSYTDSGANDRLLGTQSIYNLESSGGWYALYSSCYHIGNVPDGTSKTVLVGEKTSGANLWPQPCFSIPISAAQFGVVLNGNSGSGGYSYWTPFTADGRDPPIRALPGNWRFMRPTSVHPGGLVTGLADGSVRTVSYSLSWPTWLDAITPDDGHVLGSDW